MKIINLFIALLIGLNIYSQNDTSLYQQNEIRKEIKANQNIYVDSFCINGNYRLVFNKNFNKWKEPSKWEYIEPMFPLTSIEVSDYKLLNNLVYKYIFANVDPKDAEGHLNYFIIHIYSNDKGKIKEVVVRCPTNIKLPITAFEDFEKALLNSGLTLEFPNELESIKDSKWVRRWYLYNYDRYKR